MIPYPIRITRIDGQDVSYRTTGQGSRRILFFHGFPGSSRQLSLFDSRLGPDDLTVLCLDRPGYGKSGAAPASQIAHGIRQCEGVLKELGWDRFEVVAVSGGAPLGLSLSHAMPDRVRSTKVVCGLGPMGDPRVAALMPRSTRAVMALLPRVPHALVSKLMKSPVFQGEGAARRELIFFRIFFNASPPDQLMLSDAGVQAALAQAKTEAFAQGGTGPQADARSYITPWDWEYSRFTGPVVFFHGLEDRVIPPSVSRFLAAAIPGARLELIEGEGHFSLPIRRIAQVLA